MREEESESKAQRESESKTHTERERPSLQCLFAFISVISPTREEI